VVALAAVRGESMNTVAGLAFSKGSCHLEDVEISFIYYESIYELWIFAKCSGRRVFNAGRLVQANDFDECQRWLWQQFMDSLYA
jgi:hypothetical protein